MPFNFSKKYDFFPILNLGTKQLEVIFETKLLGLIITSDCKWNKNTEYIVKRARTQIWTLRRLKGLGASTHTILDIYCLIIRSVLESNAPLWSGALTQKNINDIERIQKTCFKVILSGKYHSYESALKTLNMEKLEQRRKNLCIKFAKKCTKNPKMSFLFHKRNTRVPTRKNKHPKPYIEPLTHTKRVYTGCVPYLARLLNKVEMKKTSS